MRSEFGGAHLYTIAVNSLEQGRDAYTGFIDHVDFFLAQIDMRFANPLEVAECLLDTLSLRDPV